VSSSETSIPETAWDVEVDQLVRVGRVPITAARDIVILTWLKKGALALIAATPSLADMQPIDGFAIDRTEVTVGQFRKFVDATGYSAALCVSS
jgi:hypothetical protein